MTKAMAMAKTSEVHRMRFQRVREAVRRGEYSHIPNPYVRQWAAFYDLIGQPYVYLPETEGHPHLPNFMLPTFHPEIDTGAYLRIALEDGFNLVACYRAWRWPQGKNGPWRPMHLLVFPPIVHPNALHLNPDTGVNKPSINPLPISTVDYAGFTISAGVINVEGNEGWDGQCVWYRCDTCGAIGIEQVGYYIDLCECHTQEHYAETYSPWLVAAYLEALSLDLWS